MDEANEKRLAAEAQELLREEELAGSQLRGLWHNVRSLNNANVRLVVKKIQDLVNQSADWAPAPTSNSPFRWENESDGIQLRISDSHRDGYRLYASRLREGRSPKFPFAKLTGTLER